MLDKNLLRGAIVKKGFTQELLAEMIGMSSNTLSSRINGLSSFNTDEIDRICQALDIVEDSEKVDIFLSSSSQKWDK